MSAPPDTLSGAVEVRTPLVVQPTTPPPKPPRPPRPPKPPRRAPRPHTVPLSPARQTTAQVARLFSMAMLGIVAYVTFFGGLEHSIVQDHLRRSFSEQLAAGTAPVSEGTFEDVLLRDGAPVAQLRIPQLGIDETVVEGTDAANLKGGPGHRRDTSLPGQVGVSVIMGRAAAFGGPFRRIEELAPGERFTVVTGGGEHEYEVMGVRYAGDLSPAPLKGGEGRLVLATARGPAFVPQSVVRVDAELVSEPTSRGARQTTYQTLPSAHKELAGDTARAWALVFALQLLLAVAIGAVWTYRRIGVRQAWAVFLPVGLLAYLVAADQAVRMLPNLM
jgi:LPXTG-site transpeptidase (sortase) family protein